MNQRLLPLAAIAAIASACATAGAPGATARTPLPACDAGNAGIELPAGFCARVVADVSSPRHMAVAPNGDLFVSSRGVANATNPTERGGVFALRDADGDGRAETRAFFGPEGGTGIEFRDGHLYFATNTAVLRYRMGAGLEPAAGPDTLVYGLPGPPGHASKTITLDGSGSLFVDVGSPGNACQPQAQDRAGGVPGEDPCSQLATRGGVWRFDANRLRQTQAQGERWATGIRNAVAFTWNPLANALFAVAHGRETLNNWPGFTAEDNAVRVAEELQLVNRGADFGWPYCYFDLQSNRRVLNPEYGGNGREVGRCADKTQPIMTFPAHSAPNDILFYTGRQFPERYRGGAFIAFHGPGNPRSPGFRVAFVPFRGAAPTGPEETFAGGFAPGATTAAEARYRPMGLAEGPDGSLYIADSKTGRVWRVVYTGPRGGR